MNGRNQLSFEVYLSRWFYLNALNTIMSRYYKIWPSETSWKKWAGAPLRLKHWKTWKYHLKSSKPIVMLLNIWWQKFRCTIAFILEQKTFHRFLFFFLEKSGFPIGYTFFCISIKKYIKSAGNFGKISARITVFRWNGGQHQLSTKVLRQRCIVGS